MTRSTVLLRCASAPLRDPFDTGGRLTQRRRGAETQAKLRFAECAVLAVVALVITGCAGWKPNLVSAPVTAERKVREFDAVRSFEERRDLAQLQAALDRWQQGDAAGCEARLVALVERRPDYVEARLRLAEVLLARGEAAASEQHLRAAVEQEPERAEAHHALGMVLDAAGRREEARRHLLRAVELEPQNEVYRLTVESVAAEHSQG